MNRLILHLLVRLPQGALSRFTGWLAHRPVASPLRGIVIGGFARAVGIRTDEAEAPPTAYPSIGAYFVRHLRPGVRTWPAALSLPTSPVDGVVGSVGEIRDGRVLQAKGLDYSLEELVGDGEEAAPYHGGTFVTIYLSPRHYHRIHAPISGLLTRARSIPGRLMPVHLGAVREVRDLFPKNERLVIHLNAPDGLPVAVVAVGAFNVGRISAAFEPGWETNQAGGASARRPEVRTYARPTDRGDEIAAFHLGSTVVLLFGAKVHAGGLVLHPDVVPGADIQLGAPLFTGG
jgi:phosphatidylserine decarboxylase